MKGLQPKGIARRNKMLLAAIQLFLDQGYEKTTTAQIARAAGMSPTSFFAAFENKEALLLTLTQIMFENQFAKARAFAKDMEPLMVYCLETSLQIYITELSAEGDICNGVYPAKHYGIYFKKYSRTDKDYILAVYAGCGG